MIGFLVSIIVMITSWFAFGFVALQNYNWFLLPLGLPSLSMFQMIGIRITIGILMPVKTPGKREETKIEDLLTSFVFTILISAIVLLSGYIIYLFAEVK